jgi:hypothetical protein
VHQPSYGSFSLFSEKFGVVGHPLNR